MKIISIPFQIFIYMYEDIKSLKQVSIQKPKYILISIKTLEPYFLYFSTGSSYPAAPNIQVTIFEGPYP